MSDLNRVKLQWSASGQFDGKIFTDQMIISEYNHNVNLKLCNSTHNITQCYHSCNIIITCFSSQLQFTNSNFIVNSI